MKSYSNERGIALMSVILLILVLSFVSAAAILTSTTELQIGGNFKTATQAFYNAEAGLQFALAQMKNKQTAGTLSISGTNPVVHYAAPTSVDPLISFSNVTTVHLTRIGTSGYYTFPVTGYYANTSASVTAVLYPGGSGLIPPGISATNGIKTGNNFSITGGTVSSATTITGSASSSTGATAGATLIVDPLGAVALVSSHNYSASNNNAAAGIAGNSINGSKTLNPGNYYLTSLTMGNNDTLTFNATTGPVNIYLTANTPSLDKINMVINGSNPVTIYYHGSGPFKMKTNSQINSGGNASNFSFVCDTTAIIEFENNTNFNGFIYAPFSNLKCGNSFNFTGTMAVKSINEAGNSFAVTYSPPNGTVFPGVTASGTPSIMSWKQM